MVLLFAVAMIMTLPSRAADNLKLNERLDYSSDQPRRPADHRRPSRRRRCQRQAELYHYYGEGCSYPNARPATVELYEKYKDRVRFVLWIWISRAPERRRLVKRSTRDTFPHVTVLNRDGRSPTTLR